MKYQKKLVYSGKNVRNFWKKLSLICWGRKKNKYLHVYRSIKVNSSLALAPKNDDQGYISYNDLGLYVLYDELGNERWIWLHHVCGSGKHSDQVWCRGMLSNCIPEA